MKTKKQPHNFVEDDLIANEDLRKAYLQGYGKGRAEGILIGENNQHNNSGSLKTLKDLFEKERNGKLQKYHSVDIQLILKAEAIKRAKLYTHKANLKGIEDDEIKYWTARRVEVMEFNNLTEEDLK